MRGEEMLDLCSGVIRSNIYSLMTEMCVHVRVLVIRVRIAEMGEVGLGRELRMCAGIEEEGKKNKEERKKLVFVFISICPPK
jgi:hypothetical protein